MSLAAWYSGWLWGVALAAVLPLARLYFTTILDTPWSLTEAAINAGIRIAVLGFFAVLVDRVAVQAVALSRRAEVLEGMLPVCVLCKRVRDEREMWRPLEQYMLSKPKEQVSREVCPDCAAKSSEILDRR